MLKTFNKSKYDDSKIIIEKIKTLNFNIANAFKKMDQLLNQIHTKTNK